MKIFISYSAEDLALVEPYYARLEAEGFKPWMVDKSLLPNQNRQVEIEKAFSSAHVIMHFISSGNLGKNGLIHRELRSAMGGFSRMLATGQLLLPVALEPCSIPAKDSDKRKPLNIDAYKSWASVTHSLQRAAARQKTIATQGAKHGPFRIFIEEKQEICPGRPGQKIAINSPRFESMLYPDAAHELSALFSGRAASALLRARLKPWDQLPGYWFDRSEEEEKFSPSDTCWNAFTIDYASDSLLSLFYTDSVYNAGAAQPYSTYETYNFYINAGHVVAFDLLDIFDESTSWLERISKICMARLRQQLQNRTAKKPDSAQIDWIQRGAGARRENFSAFTVSAGHISFLFRPFQVAAYEVGPLRVNIPYHELGDTLRPGGVLGLLMHSNSLSHPAWQAKRQANALAGKKVNNHH